MRVTGRGQDQLRWPAQLVEKLSYLAEGVALVDFKPAKEQLEVNELLTERIRALRSQLDEILAKDVATFNGILKQRNVQSIFVRTP